MFIDIFEELGDLLRPEEPAKKPERILAHIVNAPTHEEEEHKEEEFTERSYFFYLSYYINEAKSDYLRHYGQVKGNKPEAWIKCWTIDMAEKLAEFEIDTEVFTNHWLVSMGLKDSGISMPTDL